MSGDDPPYLPVGTDVSAKYKGAFCEAKVSKVVRVLQLKVTYLGSGLGVGTVTDEQIRFPGTGAQPGVPGTGLLPLRVGQTIQAKHPEKKEFVNATINRIRDCSQYTVVFDDGDITTLRRTALCLKSGRHFNESETLDQLPLTHPEHFGNPVVGGRRGRRSRQLKEDSSDDDDLDELELDRSSSSNTAAQNLGRDIGKVVCVEMSEGKRKSGRDSNWFPGLIVAPTAQVAVRINIREECLIRSFKDGRYYTVPRKEITEFKREGATNRVDSPPMAEAVDKALSYLDSAELPQHWDRDTLFGLHAVDYDSDENYSDSSDDEPREEKDHFVAQLYKFMDDRGTPLNKGPIICNRDVDLYRFFRNVEKLGGFNSVTNKNRWRAVTVRLGFTKNSATTLNLVKQAYSRFLLPFEEFNRKLGCTMISNPRNVKKNRGRNLIRDKDRSTPVHVIASPRPETKMEDSSDTTSEKEKKDEERKQPKIKKEIKKEKVTDSSSSDDEIPVKPKVEPKPKKESKVIAKRLKVTGEKVKALVEKFEDKNEVQLTRSKAIRKDSTASSPERKFKPLESKSSIVKQQPQRISRPINQEEKKVLKKKKEEGGKLSDSSSSDHPPVQKVKETKVNIGDKLKVYYGPNLDSKVTYEAKVLESETDDTGIIYLVHYTGWNNRYDEWIKPHRIAENLSLTSKNKRPTKTGKHPTPSTSAGKRGRGTSLSSRQEQGGPPCQARSTTPSSVTSSSSRTKSPATPAVRAPSARLAKQAETIHPSKRPQANQSTASDSDSSSDAEEIPKRKTKRKEETPEPTDDDIPTERPKRIRKTPKKHSDSIMTLISSSSSSSNSSTKALEPEAAKGRDFDLNQIRSELKGFEKALKINPAPASDEILTKPVEAKILLNKIITSEEVKTREKSPEPEIKKESNDDVYEFKEPEPLELETRGSKLTEEKVVKKRRLLEDLDKPTDPKVKKLPIKTPPKSKYRRTFSRKSEDSESSSSPRSPRPKSPKVDNVSESIENVAKSRLIYPCNDAFDKLVVSPSFNLKASPKSEPDDEEGEEKSEEDDDDEVVSDTKSVKEEQIEVEDVKLNIVDTKVGLEVEEENEDDEEEEEDDDDDDDDDESSSDSSDEDAPIHEAIRGIEEAKDEEESADELLNNQNLFEPKLEEKEVEKPVQVVPAPTATPSPPTPPPQPIEPEIKITPPTESLSTKKSTTQEKTPIREKTPLREKTPPPREKTPEPTKPKSPTPPIKPTNPTIPTIKKEEKVKISPALQETDSSLLEAAINQPSPDIPITENLFIPKRTGPRIAGSILQKFDAIKKKEENPSPVKSETSIPDIETEIILEDVKPVVEELTIPQEPKKRIPKKNLTRDFEDYEDSDSSDSDGLVIARSDDDSRSRTGSIEKLDTILQKQEEESKPLFEADKEVKEEVVRNEDEPDSNISLLLCEETIPGSPAPVTDTASNVVQEQVRPKPKSAKSLVMEIPFASAPGTSKTLLSAGIKIETKDAPVVSGALGSGVTVGNLIGTSVEKLKVEDSGVVNSAPSTPDSSLSNISPMGENGGSSPGTADESTKSHRGVEAGDIEQSFSGLRVLKPHRYSEEDTILPAESTKSSIKHSPRSVNEDSQPALNPSLSSPNHPTTSIVLSGNTGIQTCRKRRKSFKGDDTPSHAPPGAKRGRKPNALKNVRNIPSCTNSDSDDASEHSSATSGTTVPIGPGSGSMGEIRLLHSTAAASLPRQSKYNFMIDFEPCMDQNQKIALIQQKISEIRKAYSNEKNELASIERRMKKIRRREREAMKAAKQEVAACS